VFILPSARKDRCLRFEMTAVHLVSGSEGQSCHRLFKAYALPLGANEMRRPLRFEGTWGAATLALKADGAARGMVRNHPVIGRGRHKACP